jgi:hypothetical protein
VKIKSEKGQALPLVMLAVMVGAMVIPPFLGHVGASLTGSRTYGQEIASEYAADAGAEHAIWSLTYGGLDEDIPNAGDTVSYTLPESVNGLTPSVTVTNLIQDMQDYAINATAGDRLITAEIKIDNGAVDILSWYFK